MLLFTPGPTPVLESTRVAMSEPTIHHRTPEFEAIFGKTREYLKDLFGMQDVLMLASSGTGAMEASVLNLCHSKALTINSGKFGERFGKICKACNKPYVELVYDWHTPASLEDIERVLKNDSSIDAIFFQICESAGGLRHPAEEIAKLVKSFDRPITVVCDGITAVGVEKIDITNIDALISGSQKALMLPPGLALIGLSKDAIDKIGSGKGFYFNLATELKNQQKNTTAWTAATTLIIGLKSMMETIYQNGGLDTLYNQTKKRSNATQEAIKSIGLNIYPKTPACSMTTIYHQDSKSIRSILKKEFNINIAGGQDHLSDTIMRINHMGIIPDYESVWAVNAIEMALDKMGLRKFDGRASATFSKFYI